MTAAPPLIEDSRPADAPLLDSLYPAAFPDEDLSPLVRTLLAEPSGVMSLTARVGGALVGHVLFTTCGLPGAPAGAALLGPLAVAPAHQRRGVGSALVRAGLERLRADGIAHVFVLGDPAYYSRLGFAPAQETEPPYALPPAWAEAWGGLALAEGVAAAGRLEVPPPWRDPALWS